MRIPISGKKRFEILERDNFACRYCGQKAPAVVLHVDHVMPVSQGGSNDDGNLSAACTSCNLGKRDAVLPGFGSPQFPSFWLTLGTVQNYIHAESRAYERVEEGQCDCTPYFQLLHWVSIAEFYFFLCAMSDEFCGEESADTNLLIDWWNYGDEINKWCADCVDKRILPAERAVAEKANGICAFLGELEQRFREAGTAPVLVGS